MALGRKNAPVGPMFDNLPVDFDWTPKPLPSLAGIKNINFDTETDGLDWLGGSKPVGCSVHWDDGTEQYIPWGHSGGGNLPEDQCRQWAKRELRGKHLRGSKIKFDIHEMREWGVDLEEQGCTFSDIGHTAALLDDHRYRFGLDALCKDYLGEEKVGKKLDTKRMRSYHAGQVAPRAEADVRQVGALWKVMKPMIEEQGLGKVHQLEDDVIPAVIEMEKNGAKLNVELLNKWNVDMDQDIQRCLYRVGRDVGFKVDPNKNEDWVKLFTHLKLPIENFTHRGAASFTDAILRRIDDPIIKLVRRAKKLSSIKAKYIHPYLKSIGKDGKIRYELHQLKTEKGEGESIGTVSGRFSATDENIQQVMGVERWEASFGSSEYLIRELFIADEPSYEFLSADAMQVEYRGFAHYANSARINQAYQEDPRLSFHKLIHKLLLEFKPDLIYKLVKDLNFAKIYGAGLVKMAVMLGFITEAQAQMLYEIADYRTRIAHPLLKETVEINEIYKRELPEATALLEEASRLAKERGYVRTILGRRSRFPGGDRAHKALNAVVQGTAADINKLKLVELHRERKRTGFKMSMTVHDEVCGSAMYPETKAMVDEILNRQSVPMRVPILWDTNTGANWAVC